MNETNTAADTESNTETGNDADSDRPYRLYRHMIWALWGLAFLMVVVLLAWTRFGASTAGDLPVYQEVSSFELTNRDGTTVTPESFEGKPWVADFIFTSCPGVCPILTDRMAALAEDVPLDEMHLVSFSVDPENDTPEVLREYAEEHDAPDGWYFLTGTRDEIHELVKEGFLLMLDDSPKRRAEAERAAAEGESADAAPGDLPPDPIVHSNRFVLVDSEGRIRGYYNAFDADELEALRRDLDRLL